MWAVLKKEFKSYFLSPIGYVFIGLFLAMCSLFFYITAISMGTTNFEYMFYYAAQSLTFIIPILTMRMFSEERKNGTEQLLLTSPRSMIGITLGKYFAAVLVTLVTELFTLVFFAILCYFKVPDITVTIMTLVGFLLLSMAYISFGMFASSITENQIIAATITIAAFILTWFLPSVSNIFNSVSLLDKFYPFTTGVIPIAETISLIAFSALFIILTIIIMTRRKLVK